MAIGDSLAKGLAKRWSREMLQLEERVRAICYECKCDHPGRYLRRVCKRLSSLDSPWILEPVRIEGKRKKMTLYLVTVNWEEEMERFVVFVSTMCDHAADVHGMVEITPHGMQRLIQLVGDADRRAVARRVHAMTGSIVDLTEREIERGGRENLPWETKIVGDDVVYILDRKEANGIVFTMRTCVADEALGGKLRNQVLHTRNGLADSYVIRTDGRLEVNF